MRDAIVLAVPLSPEEGSVFSMECSLCGPVGTTTKAAAPGDSEAHLKEHGYTVHFGLKKSASVIIPK